MSNELFRKEAIERLSSPERLDELMTVVNRRAWLPLAAMGSLVFVGAVWSVFGRIPLTVKGQGILIYPSRVEQIQALGEGRITKLKVTSGDSVKKGDVIAEVEQHNIKLQLEQERDKLRLLQSQNKAVAPVERERIALEKRNLEQQRKTLQESLKAELLQRELRDKNLTLLAENRKNLTESLIRYETKTPEIVQRNYIAIEKNRQSLDLNLQQLRESLPKLEQRLKVRERLLQQQLITEDLYLAAEQELFNSRVRISDLESQLKRLEVEKINTDSQDLQNRNQIYQIRNQLQEISVRETNVQREYLQSLNTINDIQVRLKDIDTQQARLRKQELDLDIDTNTRIKEVNNRIAQLEQELAQKSQIRSQENGKILELGVTENQIISPGTRIASIESEDQQARLMSIVYFLDKDGKQIKPGMTAQVTPSVVKRERYGGIIGTVKEVSSFPVTTQEISATLGNEELAKTFSQQGSPIAVIIELQEDPNNKKNGYKWSSSGGPDIKPSSGTSSDVRVTIGKVSPISYVLPIFREWTGIQ